MLLRSDGCKIVDNVQAQYVEHTASYLLWWLQDVRHNDVILPIARSEKEVKEMWSKKKII